MYLTRAVVLLCGFLLCVIVSFPRCSHAVNLPGFSYVVDAQGLPGVDRCPVNTYNPGMRRQRTCWPCPAGYTTNGMTGRTDVTACGRCQCLPGAKQCLMCICQHTRGSSGVHVSTSATHQTTPVCLQSVCHVCRVSELARHVCRVILCCAGSGAGWLLHAVPNHCGTLPPRAVEELGWS